MAMAPPAWPSAPPPQRNRLFGGSQVKLINEFAEPPLPPIALYRPATLMCLVRCGGV